MEFLKAVKTLGLIDIVVLAMLDMGYTPTEIASKASITRQTVYDTKKRNKALTERIRGQ